MKSNRKKGEFGLSNFIIDQLQAYIALVNLGLRDSYLVDCCSLTNDQALDLCKDNAQNVFILTLQHDIFIVNTSIFLTKPTNTPSTLICVDVDSSDPIVIENDLARSYLIKLIELFQPIKDNLNVKGDKEVLAFDLPLDDCLLYGGLSLLAGFLLGYPCLYKSTSSINCLAMRPLTQIAFTIATATPSSASSSAGSIDLQVFTIPSSILENDPDFSANIHTHIQCRLAHLQSLLLSPCHDLSGTSNGRCFCAIHYTVNLSLETKCMPSLSL